MQRYHEQDFVGHILELDDWKVVSFPAIAQQDERHVVRTPYGSYIHRRCEGEALHPEREPLEALHRLRRNLGIENFSAQYLQMPVPPEGGIVKIQQLQRYRLADLPETFDYVLQSWDTGNKATERHDPSVCTTWGVKGPRIYLLHVLRARMEYPDLKKTIRSHAIVHGACIVLVEDKASGTPVLQDLVADGIRNLHGVIPQGDKQTRMEIQASSIANGFVFIPEEAPWVEDYLNELAAFPNGAHDDQVDSTAQALQWFNRPRPYAGLIEFWKRQAEQAVGGDEDRMVALRGPRSGPVYVGKSGIIHPGSDGLFRMPLRDAKLLLNLSGWSLVEKEMEPTNAPPEVIPTGAASTRAYHEEDLVALRGPITAPIYVGNSGIIQPSPDGVFRMRWRDAQIQLQVPGWFLVDEDTDPK